MARLEWNLDDAKVAWKEEAMEEGMEKGMEKGLLSSLKNLMKNMNLSLERAMDVLQIQGDDRKKYAGLVNA